MEDEVSIEAKIIFVINSPISPKSKISNFCHFIRMKLLIFSRKKKNIYQEQTCSYFISSLILNKNK